MEHFFKIFNNSEVNASNFLEDFEEMFPQYYTHSNMFEYIYIYIHSNMFEYIYIYT